MSYTFPPELRQLVQQGLATGRYPSEDAMLVEALQVLRERDADLERFKANLRERLDRLDRGEGIELENDDALRGFFDDIQTRGKERYDAGKAAP